jgi:adenylate cyclase
LYLRAEAQFRKWTVESSREAVGLLRRALVFDPSYAPAAGLFAACRVQQMLTHGISEEEVVEGARLARQAIEIGQEDPVALALGGFGIFVLAGERASGLSAIERALALNPNHAIAWMYCGSAHGFSHHPAPAIEALQRAIRLSPLDPQRWAFYGGLALAHLVAGGHEEAVEWADRALHENPKVTIVVEYKAVACGYLGRIEEGRECVRRLCELRPGSTIATVEKVIGGFASPEVVAIYLEGLRKAGLPEQ